LEFLVAEARDHGAKTVISGGALQSNHCRKNSTGKIDMRNISHIFFMTGAIPNTA